MPSNGNSEEQSYARFNERQRLLLVSVTSALLDSNVRQDNGSRLDANAIASVFEGNVNTHPRLKDVEPPFVPAADFIMSSPRLVALLGYADVDAKTARKDIIEGCRYWFNAIATDPCRQSLADKPRATKSDEGLSNADFHWLGKQLQEQEWRDAHGNRRRYPGLEAMLQGCTQASEADDCDPDQKAAAAPVAERLLAIKAKATGDARNNLDNLLQRVALKCKCVRHACTLCPK